METAQYRAFLFGYASIAGRSATARPSVGSAFSMSKVEVVSCVAACRTTTQCDTSIAWAPATSALPPIATESLHCSEFPVWAVCHEHRHEYDDAQLYER
jgi:hypothetical protein